MTVVSYQSDGQSCVVTVVSYQSGGQSCVVLWYLTSLVGRVVL